MRLTTFAVIEESWSDARLRMRSSGFFFDVPRFCISGGLGWLDKNNEHDKNVGQKYVVKCK
jgi:hypothetical protein